jgi:hypothetical protein
VKRRHHAGNFLQTLEAVLLAAHQPSRGIEAIRPRV